jgi:chemotaxis family two-component system response regulator Rcp1
MIDKDNACHQMEILLIEDNLADACSAIVALKEGKIPHRLTLIRDGVEAMEFLHQDGKFARAPRPDLILLDLQLPYKDGREVLNEVKADFDLL